MHIAESTYQFEEPLLHSLMNLLKNELPSALKVASPFGDDSALLGTCGKLPDVKDFSLDLDSSSGVFPLILLTHTRAESSWTQTPPQSSVETDHTIEITYLAKLQNDFCDVIEIHRVTRAIKLILLHAKKTDFGQYFRSDTLAKISLKSPLTSQALFLNNGNKLLRGMTIVTHFSVTEHPQTV